MSKRGRAQVRPRAHPRKSKIIVQIWSYTSMTDTPETAQSGNFSENIAQEVENLLFKLTKLSKKEKDLIERVVSEIQDSNPSTLPGAARIGQLLLFLKEKLKPKQYEEALANSLGWISGIANQLIKLAPILGEFTYAALNKISLNLSSSALYKLATGRTPLEVIKSTLQQACTSQVSKKDIQQQTKNYKESQPKKKPTPWRYAGNGREYQPPRVSEKAGLVVEELSVQKGIPRRFLLEDAVSLLAEKFQQAVT